jgi:hypothetical protein
MSSTSEQRDGFNTASAVTRSLLGWGVVVGPFYLVAGLVLALTREGFDFAQHPLSLLMLGELGWLQALNLILSGLMTIAAALGFMRAMRGSRAAGWAGGLIGGYGICLIASGIFPPDPMAGFPPGATPSEPTTSGMLHFAFGAIGFLLLVAACFVVAAWCARREETSWAWYSRASGAVVVLGFAAGGFMPSPVFAVVLLWIAVVAIWAWLAAASVHLYRTVPHPDAQRRSAAAGTI